MKTLKEYILEAEENKIAIGHFNFSNLEIFHGIIEAAEKLRLPVILALSEGEGDFVGIHEAVALVKIYREKYNLAIFLNADHTHSFEKAKEVIDAGFDAVTFDAVKLPMEENIKLTKEVLAYAKEVSKKENREILIEAELGYIGTSSKVLEEIPEGAGDTLTNPEEAKSFVEKTGIDLLAPSIGNIHGMIKSGNPKLDIKRIAEIRREAGVPLVLHGGSGILDEDFQNGIKAGVSIIHINTEIRLAYREALEKSLAENKEIAPYKYLKEPKNAVKDVVGERLKLFAGL